MINKLSSFTYSLFRMPREEKILKSTKKREKKEKLKPDFHISCRIKATTSNRSPLNALQSTIFPGIFHFTANCVRMQVMVLGNQFNLLCSVPKKPEIIRLHFINHFSSLSVISLLCISHFSFHFIRPLFSPLASFAFSLIH